MKIPEITRTPIWSVGAVWAACVKNELYTMGNNFQQLCDQVNEECDAKYGFDY